MSKSKTFIASHSVAARDGEGRQLGLIAKNREYKIVRNKKNYVNGPARIVSGDIHDRYFASNIQEPEAPEVTVVDDEKIEE